MLEKNALIDVIIAVHQENRPVTRAVKSIFQQNNFNQYDINIIVVCHHVPINKIKAKFTDQEQEKITFLHVDTGNGAGVPFNEGIEKSYSKYFTIMGSDDWLEPDALFDWFIFAKAHELDAVIAPEHHANGKVVRTPPTRIWKKYNLDFTKDHLAYRTAPLALINRNFYRRQKLSFDTDVQTGEDQRVAAVIWSQGKCGFNPNLASYIVGADAAERTSTKLRPIEKNLEFLWKISEDSFYQKLSNTQLISLIVKCFRVHVFAEINARSAQNKFSDQDYQYLQKLYKQFQEVTPGFNNYLSQADEAVLQAVNSNKYVVEIQQLAKARRNFGTPNTITPVQKSKFLHPDSPVNFMLFSGLMK